MAKTLTEEKQVQRFHRGELKKLEKEASYNANVRYKITTDGGDFGRSKRKYENIVVVLVKEDDRATIETKVNDAIQADFDTKYPAE